MAKTLSPSPSPLSSAKTINEIAIFLDIDGVLLPFPTTESSSSNSSSNNNEAMAHVAGSIFPSETLAALSLLLEGIQNIGGPKRGASSFSSSLLQQGGSSNSSANDGKDENEKSQSAPPPPPPHRCGDAVVGGGSNDDKHEHGHHDYNNDYVISVILSSTWRVRRDYIQQIEDSFDAYGAHVHATTAQQKHGGECGSGSSSKRSTTTTNPLFNLRIRDITDPKLHSERREEIYQYLLKQQLEEEKEKKKNTFVAWLAVDDEELLLPGEDGNDSDDDAAQQQQYLSFQGKVLKPLSHVGLTNQLAKEGFKLVRKQLLLYQQRQRQQKVAQNL